MAITNLNQTRTTTNSSASDIELRSIEIDTTERTESTGLVMSIENRIDLVPDSDSNATATGIFNQVESLGSNKVGYIYGDYNESIMNSTGGITGVVIGAQNYAKYKGSEADGSNVSWASVYGTYSRVSIDSASSGELNYVIGNNVKTTVSSANTNVDYLQGQHVTVQHLNGNVNGDLDVNLLDFDNGSGTVSGDMSYLRIMNDTVPNVSGTARAINSQSVLPSRFAGSVQIGESTITEDSENAGALRYVSSTNRSAVEMLMQTGAATYTWVVVKENTW